MRVNDPGDSLARRPCEEILPKRNNLGDNRNRGTRKDGDAKYRGRIRVLCVALWRTRPSVLFVLEARFSLPIDRERLVLMRIPIVGSPPFAVFPLPQQPSFSILFRSCIRAMGNIGPRGYLDSGYCAFEKSMFHQSSDISPTSGDFPDSRRLACSIDLRKMANIDKSNIQNYYIFAEN